jgi:SNF2 family DNA or RNA helicase
MDEAELLALIKVYKGNNFFVKALRDSAIQDKPISPASLTIAKRVLITDAIKKDDRTLLPLPEVKDFEVDFSKYSIKPPFDFQKVGINWLLNKIRCILADSMGLGKTYQAIIGFLELNITKVLIVCPKSIMYNWKREIVELTGKPEEITIITDDNWKSNKYLIINYDRIHKYLKRFEKEKIQLIVGDESHMIKSGRKSRRGISFQKIATKSKRVWLLTGTPIANKPIDFYQLLKVCKHELGKNKEYFGRRYCDGQLTMWGWTYDGASNLRELHFKTQDVILRRTKEQVLTLPPKQLVPVYLQLDDKRKKAYVKSSEDKFQEIYDGINDPESVHYEKDIEGGEKFIEASAYRMFCALEKTTDGTTQELIDNVLESQNKVVVFSNFTKVLDNLKEIYDKDCIVFDGRVKDLKVRQSLIEVFQQPTGPRVFLCNYKVGSLGTTLTQANTTIMNDLPWDPATLSQAIDRIYRIGQKKKVTIYFPVYNETIDEIMLTVLQEKIKNIDVAIDGKENLTVFKYKGSVVDEVYRLLKRKAA